MEQRATLALLAGRSREGRVSSMATSTTILIISSESWFLSDYPPEDILSIRQFHEVTEASRGLLGR